MKVQNIWRLALVSNKTNIFHYYQQHTTTTTNLGKIEIISSNMNFWPWPIGMVLFWGKIVWQWLTVVTCNGHHYMIKGTYSCIVVVYQHIRISFRSTCGHSSQIYRIFKSVMISVWNHCCLMSFFSKKRKEGPPYYSIFLYSTINYKYDFWFRSKFGHGLQLISIRHITKLQAKSHTCNPMHTIPKVKKHTISNQSHNTT